MLLKRNEVRQMVLKSVRERMCVERKRERELPSLQCSTKLANLSVSIVPMKKGRCDYPRVMNE